MSFFFDVFSILVLAAIGSWVITFLAQYFYLKYKNDKSIEINNRSWLIVFLIIFTILFFCLYFRYSSKLAVDKAGDSLITQDVPVIFYPIKEANETQGSDGNISSDQNTTRDINVSGKMKESPKAVIKDEIALENNISSGMEKNESINVDLSNNSARQSGVLSEEAFSLKINGIDPETGAPYEKERDDTPDQSIRVLEQIDENRSIIYDENTSRKILEGNKTNDEQ